MRVALLPVVLLITLSLLACNQEAEESDLDDEPADQPRITASIPLLVGTPGSVAVDPANEKIYVAYTDVDVMSVLDTNSLELTATVDLPAGGLHSVAVNPASGKVYVANGGDGTVFVIDGETNEITKELRIPVASVNGVRTEIAANAAMNKIYVSRVDEDDNGLTFGYGLTIIAGDRDSVIGKVDLIGPAHAMSFDPITNDLYAVPQGWAQTGPSCPEEHRLVRIGADTDALEECLNFGHNPLGVAVSPDGTTLYHFADSYDAITNEGFTTLSVVELSTGRSLATVEYTEFTPQAITTHPDSGRMYILADDSLDSGNRDDLAQLLAMDGTTVAWSLPIGKSTVAFAPDMESGRFYIVTDERTLEVIETQ